MATIKEVAARAGVSLSTVSIVANGRAADRKISPATQERVLDAMRALGYRPNAAARRLRGAEPRTSIALFWADDFREAMLARFLRGLHEGIAEGGLDVDIMVVSYRMGQLSSAGLLHNAPGFDAAIVANANDDDLAYVGACEPMVPVALYNREVAGYPSVSVDDAVVGEMAARMVLSRRGAAGCAKRAMCLSAPQTFAGAAAREKAFAAALRDAGATVACAHVAGNDAQHGYEAVRALPEPLPDCLFAPNDLVAAGALHALHERGVLVPGEVGVVSVGSMLPEYAAHMWPPLSCVEIPMEQMARTCLQMLMERAARPADAPSGSGAQQLQLQPEAVLRSSL